MKKNFLKVVVLAVMFVFLAITAADAAITLTWDPPTTNVDGTPLTDLEGYRVYYGTASGNYDTNIDATNVVSYEVEGLIPGNTYYFAVTAYDTSGNESDYSNEVSGIADGLGVINLRIVANEATGPGYSWCWDWNTESNLAGYHVIWARTRAELETKVNNLTASVPSSEYRFAYTDCAVLTLPEFWQVTHIAVIPEDTAGYLGSTAYGHYLYGDIAETHNDGYTYQETIVFTLDVSWILYYNNIMASVPYSTNITEFADGTIYDLPAANELELSDIYQDANNVVDYYDLMMFGWYGYGWSGTD